MKNLPEFDGFWWVPSQPEDQYAGRLVSDDNTAKLILTIDKPNIRLFSNEDAIEYDVIHGRTSNGKFVSLINCFDLNSSRSSIGIETRTILVNYVLVGDLVPPNILDGAFKGIALNWSTLHRWFIKSGISVEHQQDYRSFTIKYEEQPQLHYKYSDEAVIDIWFHSNRIPFGGILSNKIEFSEVISVSLKSDSAHSLEYFIELYQELVHFFSLCLLEYTRPDEIHLIGNFNIQQHEGIGPIEPQLAFYFSTAHKPRSEKAPHPIEILIPYDAVKDEIESILQSWAILSKNISPARSLYFSSLYGQNSYIESTFLSLVQAAEVFHRRNYGGTYLDEEAYQKDVLPALTHAIPSHINKDIKQVFQERLKHFNEYSLSKRLKLMARAHIDVFEKYIPNWKQLINEIVNARNYFTHYSSTSSEEAPDINKLFEYKTFLRMLLELEMLSASSIKIDVLHPRALNCQRYKWMFPKKT